MSISDELRRDIEACAALARSSCEKMFPKAIPGKDCFYVSNVFCELWHGTGFAKKHNTKALIQGGSASFRMEHHTDDESVDTHYSYVYEPKPGADSLADVVLQFERELPEVHFWVGVIRNDSDDSIVLDLVGRYLVSLAHSVGYEWNAELTPPDIIVKSVSELNSEDILTSRYSFSPDAVASCAARICFERLVQDRGIEMSWVVSESGERIASILPRQSP